MNHETLLETLQSPSVALLRADNAALILSFLWQEFKEEPRQQRPLHLLMESLTTYLERLNVYYPDRYRSTAKEYISQWSDERGWLRIFRQGANPEYQVELTTGAQQALVWAAELQPRELLGTESRFAQILTLLNEIVLRGSTDPATRMAHLHREKQRIEAEIARIEKTGQVEGLSEVQLRERVHLAIEQAEMLLRDFTAVEERFREIARLIQQEQNKPDTRKGTIVGALLDADERLRQSDVGRSFYAFWEYIQHPQRREALDHLLDQAIDATQIEGREPRAALLRRMPFYLVDAGLKVDQTSHRLAEQLRRALDEGYAAESQRIRALASEVRALFSAHADAIDAMPGARIETLPLSRLVMARGLWSAREEAAFSFTMHNADLFEEDEAEALRVLVDQFYVDERRIQNRIELALERQPEVLLTDLLANHPVEHGLAEVLVYLHIAERDEDIHHIDPHQRDSVWVRPAQPDGDAWLLLRLPHIIFRRRGYDRQRAD